MGPWHMEWDDKEAGGAPNPYSAPAARIAEAEVRGDQPVKSGRGRRLLAVLVDGLVVAVPAIILAIALPAYRDYILRTGDANSRPFDNPWEIVAAVVLVGMAVAYVAYQVYWLRKTGQSFGKKVMGIRIVRSDGRRAGIGRLLVLRYLLPGVVANLPYLGLLFSLVDGLFIFGEPRRCLHDLLADTIVVDA